MSAPAHELASKKLDAHLAKKGLNRSQQRETILRVFMDAARHVSVDELFDLVHAQDPSIGRTTVYRSLNLFVEAGLASELALEGKSRYEVEFGRAHHDHFICRVCGEIFEFMSPEIERAQDREARKIGFHIEGHRHQILGVCASCRSQEKKK